MKKGKRTLSLVLSMLTMTSVTGCKEDYYEPENKWKEGIVVNVGGKDYTYEQFYSMLDNTKGSAQSYFTVAKNILAQLVTPKTDAILSTVDTRINDLKNTWKTNARTNKTSIKEEQEKTFESEKVENEKELRAKFIAEEQNTQNSNSYYDINVDGTTDPTYKYYISEDMTKQYVAKQAPYHVSHILVKVDASSDGQGMWDGKITADNAKKIGNVAKMLASSDTFGSIAQIASDDEGSAKQYGELYTSADGSTQIAMEKTTSYINEFKLGLYAYEAFLNPETKDSTINNSLRASLRVPGKAAKDDTYDYKDNTAVSSKMNNTLVGTGKAFGIPLSKAITLGYISDLESNIINGMKVDYASETQYPRNILFNNFFNYHGVNFMYDDSDSYQQSFLQDAIEVGKARGVSITSLSDVESKLPSKYAEYEYVSGQLSKIDSHKFAVVSGISDNLVEYTADINGKSSLTAISGSKKILLEKDDGTVNPIIIVRGGSSSYQGIHFITINNDPFINASTKHEYYRTNIPQASADKTSANSTSYEQNPSFINYVTPDVNSNTTYNTRRDTIYKVIKASDSNMEFNLWDSNVAKFKAQYGHEFSEVLGKFDQVISKYITTTREASVRGNEESLDDSWESYVQLLDLQEQVSPRGIVPQVCISAFEGGSLNGKEDICHVEK